MIPMRTLNIVLAFAFLMLVSGCDSGGGKASQEQAIDLDVVSSAGPEAPIPWPDDQLAKAFTRYWHTFFKGDAEATLRLEAPYFQELVSRKRYSFYVTGIAKSELLQVEVFDVEQRGEHFFEIPITLKLMTEDGKLKESARVDRWVLTSGGWYHVLRDVIFFPEAS